MARRLVIAIVLMVSSLSASAEGLKAVFVHGSACESRLPASVLSALREKIRTSSKYRLARALDDVSPGSALLAIYVDCSERDGVAGFATNYALAKCFGANNCHVSIDGRTLKSTLCNAAATNECGQTLFKEFDNYVNTANESTFKLN